MTAPHNTVDESPAEFIDGSGRVWRIAINVGAIVRVREQVGIDLLGLLDGDHSLILCRDYVRVAQILWAIVGGQRPDVSAEDFMDGLVGDVLMRAQACLCGAIVRFFPHQEERRVVANLLTSTMETAARLTGQIADRLTADAIMAEIEKQSLQLIAGSSSSGAPEQSA